MTPSQIEKLPKELKVTKEASATFDLVLNNQDSKVTEYIRTPLTFAYSVKKGTFIYLHMIVSGKRSNPTIELVPKIKYEDKDTKDNCLLEVSKLDYTNSPYKKNLRNLADANSERVILKKLGKIENVKDRPVKDVNNKDHVVKYTAKLKRKDSSLTINEINYIQKNIGLSTSEKVLISLSSAFIALTILFVFLGIRNLKKSQVTDLDKEVRTGKIEQLIEE